MRLMITIGAILAFVGVAALFVFRNGFLMLALGYLLYAPPDDDATLAAAFDDLAAERSATPGMTLGVAADARITCFAPMAPGAVRAAFRRVNLVLLGAGSVSYSGVIPPETRRLPALRPDLVELGGPRPDSLTPAEAESVNDALKVLNAPDTPIFKGIAFDDPEGRRELRGLVEALFGADRPCV
ncbi:MAG: hypothetical protein WD969_00015 [Paracoccaceae bacterium]